ncbi:AMP-binding protein [Rubrobacter marinus]|uniref:AMP-binding protein n=1 Tax=Rubrobacter marinus TaxID=2653852 RepID=A0A6G8Q0E2_9ACTN|nr:AMP-binding protein [Rubrobacter marinus]
MNPQEEAREMLGEDLREQNTEVAGAARTLLPLIENLPERGGREALIAMLKEGAERWTYAELAERVGRLASGLAEAGVSKGTTWPCTLREPRVDRGLPRRALARRRRCPPRRRAGGGRPRGHPRGLGAKLIFTAGPRPGSWRASATRRGSCGSTGGRTTRGAGCACSPTGRSGCPRWGRRTRRRSSTPPARRGRRRGCR